MEAGKCAIVQSHNCGFIEVEHLATLHDIHASTQPSL